MIELYNIISPQKFLSTVRTESVLKLPASMITTRVNQSLINLIIYKVVFFVFQRFVR